MSGNSLSLTPYVRQSACDFSSHVQHWSALTDCSVSAEKTALKSFISIFFLFRVYHPNFSLWFCRFLKNKIETISKIDILYSIQQTICPIYYRTLASLWWRKSGSHVVNFRLFIHFQNVDFRFSRPVDHPHFRFSMWLGIFYCSVAPFYLFSFQYFLN